MNEDLLSRIKSPKDLKGLSVDELTSLCALIRSFLVESISKTGGHLASNLGMVELTVALHKCFDCPNDKLIFDVGHQCYTHKILTGRKDGFDALRKMGGISGFPKPSESEYDNFVSGHASTSISVAYGMAQAMKLKGENGFAVAIIGDGAFTGGQAYEALNNAGRSKTRLIVILNHNDMSISKNVGAVAKYLSKIRSGPGYLKLKRRTDRVLSKIPLIGKPVLRWLEHSKSTLKTVLYRSTFFEEMGFQYFGPVDGHNITELLRVLSTAKESNLPVLIQVETVKGKGYGYAEENPGAYHAIGGFDILNGGDNVLMSECFSNCIGEELTRLANEDKRICAITAAMKYGTGLHSFYSAHKSRFFDVGIAEAHAVTFAGGLASQGLVPVFCVYSSFLQRSYDQIIHDLSIDKKHVVLCVDRAGLVGEDGETHQGIFDVSFLSEIPGVSIYSPDSYEEARLCLQQAINEHDGVVAVRYPRGAEKRLHDLPPDINYTYKDEGGDILVISYGRAFSNCFEALKLLKSKEESALHKASPKASPKASLLKLCRVAPLDLKVLELAMNYKKILFVEEGIKTGGIAMQLCELLVQRGYKGIYKTIAVEGFVKQATVEESFVSLKMDKNAIADCIDTL